jgi:carbohydrate binding protein with CBM5/12 domain
MPLVLRAVKGSNLTPAEADGNFTYLDGRIVTLEGLPLGVGIDHIEVLGNQMTIFLTDSSTQGPFTLLTAQLNFRGEWQASTAYSTNDIISFHNSIYQVLADHTSATAFDPGEVIDTATEVYGLWLAMAGAPVQTISITTWTPAATDSFTYVRFTNASGCTVTIPDDGDVTIDVGTEIHCRQAGAGQVIIVGDNTGVLINPQFGCENISAGEGATFTLKKVDTNEWDLFGRLQTTSA